MNAIRVLRQLVIGPTGQHRGARAGTVPARVEVSLDDLLGPLTLAPFPEPPDSDVLPQAWQYCPAPSCRKDTRGVVHEGGWTCGECLAETGDQR